jgi:hypothetical protein
MNTVVFVLLLVGDKARLAVSPKIKKKYKTKILMKI